MLQSLRSPNVLCIKDINNNFLWCGKTPKLSKEICEGEVYHGGVKQQCYPL